MLLIPKNKKLWAFGAWQGDLYSDNTKCLFEYLNSIDSSKKFVWITKSKAIKKQVKKLGYKVVLMSTPKGYFAMARANVFFLTEAISDVTKRMGDVIHKKATVIQLWHGMGIKSVGIDSGLYYAQDKEAFKKYIENNSQKWYWLCASEEAKEKYSKAFGVSKDRFYITGQPKDDTFVNVKESDYISELRKTHPNSKIAVYLPTHRNFGINEKIADVMSIESLEKVNKQLQEKNIVMIFKPHFHEFEKYKGYETSFSNIIFAIDKEKFGDVYEFLPCCDLMITDYSGIMFGYLASGKPIVYFTYDYDEYANHDAGFCYDFDDIAYGPVCKTWNEVVDALSTITSEDYAELREKQRTRFCPYSDGNNCQRVYHTTLKILENKN